MTSTATRTTARTTRVLAAAVLVVGHAACRGGDPLAHDHEGEHAHGHEPHAGEHGHGAEGAVSFTRWTDRTEWFAEHAPLVVGRESTFLVHVTQLESFKPVSAGTLTLSLDGPATMRAQAAAPLRPGIFAVSVTPTQAGTYRGAWTLGGDAGDTLPFEVTVHSTAPKPAEEADEGRIQFLKEQQWSVPFRTAFAQVGTLVATLEVAGTVDTPPGGTAIIGAPVAGRVVAPPKGLPLPGTMVKQGELLARFAPAPATPEEAARAVLAVSEAEARVAASAAALARAERLYKDAAVSLKELEDARRDATVAEAMQRAASEAAQLFAGVRDGRGQGAWALVSPIEGVLAEVHATPGEPIAAGTLLFRVVDTGERWIRARIPEQDAARVRTDRDAAYAVTGNEAWKPLGVSGPDANARVVSLGASVDTRSRTVELIYALRAGDPDLRVGGLVRLAVPTGVDFEGVLVPRDAVIDDDGRSVVYVQVDGEHFEERAVTLGPVTGDTAGIASGLKAGERIATRGAGLVRLASKAGAGLGHGHVH